MAASAYDTLPEEPDMSPVAAAPVRLGDRFASLDTLRGFALLGILILNIEDFAGPEGLWDIPVGVGKPAFIGWHARLDEIVVTLKWLFAEGKMRSIFAMLFGAGVVLLTERINRRGDPSRVAKIFYRRNLWLLLFGLIHGFVIWFGDILFDYAALGLIVLYPLQHLGARKLVIIGLAVWVIGGTFGSTRALHVADVLRNDTQLTAANAAGSAVTPAQYQMLAAAEVKRKQAIVEREDEIRKGRLGFIAGWPNRVEQELSFLALKFQSGWILEWMGAMIAGMGLYKAGFLTNRRPVRDYVVVAVVGYVVSLPIVLIGLWQTWQAGLTEAAQDRWMMIPYSTEVAAGALANAAVVLLLTRSQRMRGLLYPLSAVGRTALTNYILTSVTCQIVFAWGPWKLFGKIEFYQYYLVVLAVWAVNLTLSPLWLRFFAFGPLEWLWRSLTYWKLQPLLLSRFQRVMPLAAS